MTTQIQLTFKDAKCPVFFADGQPVAMWNGGDGVVRAQFRSIRISDPAAGGDVSPLLEVVMPLATFFSMLDAANIQAEQLKQQGVQRVPLTATAPTNTGGPTHQGTDLTPPPADSHPSDGPFQRDGEFLP